MALSRTEVSDCIDSGDFELILHSTDLVLREGESLQYELREAEEVLSDLSISLTVRIHQPVRYAGLDVAARLVPKGVRLLGQLHRQIAEA